MTPEEIIKELELNYGYEFDRIEDRKREYKWLKDLIKDVSDILAKNKLMVRIKAKKPKDVITPRKCYCKSCNSFNIRSYRSGKKCNDCGTINHYGYIEVKD